MFTKSGWRGKINYKNGEKSNSTETAEMIIKEKDFYCKSCGKKISILNKFCSACGTEIEG